ncbi:MAG TPA: serine/threonine-protein kinase [Polyangia bacterium]|nr:serine/threonine-protein kinase [Polyangia bacterium]
MADFPRRWGAYVLMRPLGSGGMGTVSLALTRAGGEEAVCVIKRLTPETLSDESRRKRFQREAEISRTLSYSGIAKTIATGEEEGEPYIAQEYIEGRNLAQLCAAARGVGERLSPIMVAHIGERVASALAYAHRRDVVHRDIAPSNVMIGFEGAVSLIDFGIARRSTDASLTATGAFIGRAVYTAPEVLVQGEADPRTDIYSLGVLLWELLVGRPPALGELETHPGPSSVATSEAIPTELEKLIVRAVDVDPARRFSCAEDFSAGLLQVAPAAEATTREITRLIGRCYEVAREHQLLKADLDEARPLLRDTLAPRRDGEPIASGRSPLRRRLWLYALCAVTASFALVLALRRGRPSEPFVATAPAAPGPATAPHWRPPPAPNPLGTATTPPPSAVTPPARLPSRPVSHTKLAAAAARTTAAELRPAARSAAAGRLLDRARDSLTDGDYDDAIRSAREALEIGSARQQAAAHLVVGKVLLAQGKRNPAAEEFAAAVELDPENTAASEHLASLRRKGAE